MTPKEIEAARKTLPHGVGSFKVMTEEQRRLYHELAWREHINSCLVYGQLHHAITPDNCLDRRVYQYGTDSTYHIGEWISESRAVEIAREQESDLNAKATVYLNTYTDYEGCSYNSVVWAE